MIESRNENVSVSQIGSSYLSETSKKELRKPKTGRAIQIVKWTEEEDKKLFMLYKKKGSCWSSIATEFENRNENQVKNRFYSTLRRMAIKMNGNKSGQGDQPHKSRKEDLVKYVDDAILYGHHCRSKRGRKRKSEISKAIGKQGNKSAEEVENIQVKNILENPEYLSLLITENERLLKDLDEKVTKDNNENSLLSLREVINGQLKTTQEVLQELDRNKESIS